MKALVYLGPGKCAWQDKEKPSIQAMTDVVVKISRTTICGTDLHILKGDLPTVESGRILGHEGVGEIVEKGEAVATFAVGDRVLVSCITSCGHCGYCRRQMYSHCERGGWILGNRIDGTQAEYVRIPFADNSLYHAPPGVNAEALLMLSDILPTGFECGVLNGAVKPGDAVAIVGAGPVGLAALMTCRLFSPAMIIAIDMDGQRLTASKEFGATHTVKSGSGNAVEAVLKLTGGIGVDVAIEAVGLPDSFDLCQQILAPGGHLANIGVHGKPVTLNMDKLWDRNITLTTRLVDTVSTPMLLKAMLSGAIMPAKVVSHRFRLSEMLKAYDTFSNAIREHALKVVLSAGE
jgi:alcohol dehydrogenase